MFVIKLIFIGMLLIFLNFDLEIGASSIGILPNFLGYFFMFEGIAEVVEFSDYFYNLTRYRRGVIGYSALIYAADLLGLSSRLPTLITVATGLATTALSLFISYNILMGVRDIESGKSQNLNSHQLYFAWKLVAVFSVLPYLTLFAPPLALVSIMLGFAAGVYYLFAFYTAMDLFYRGS